MSVEFNKIKTDNNVQSFTNDNVKYNELVKHTTDKQALPDTAGKEFSKIIDKHLEDNKTLGSLLTWAKQDDNILLYKDQDKANFVDDIIADAIVLPVAIAFAGAATNPFLIIIAFIAIFYMMFRTGVSLHRIVNKERRDITIKENTLLTFYNHTGSDDKTLVKKLNRNTGYFYKHLLKDKEDLLVDMYNNSSETKLWRNDKIIGINGYSRSLLKGNMMLTNSSTSTDVNYANGQFETIVNKKEDRNNSAVIIKKSVGMLSADLMIAVEEINEMLDKHVDNLHNIDVIEKIIKMKSLYSSMGMDDAHSYSTIVKELLKFDKLFIMNDLVDNNALYVQLDSMLDTVDPELDNILNNISDSKNEAAGNIISFVEEKFNKSSDELDN